MCVGAPSSGWNERPEEVAIGFGFHRPVRCFDLDSAVIEPLIALHYSFIAVITGGQVMAMDQTASVGQNSVG